MEKLLVSPRCGRAAGRPRSTAPAASVCLVALALVCPSVAVRAQDAKGGAAGKGHGTVLVDNRLERDVTLWVNGLSEGRCAAAETCELRRIPAGALQLKASTGSQGPVASASLALDEGETFTWTLYPLLEWGEEKGTGTIVLVNRLDQPVTVLFGENPAGTLPPGATRAYPRVVAGKVDVRVRDGEGGDVADRTLEVQPGTLRRWEIGAPERRAEREPSERGTPRKGGGGSL